MHKCWCCQKQLFNSVQIAQNIQFSSKHCSHSVLQQVRALLRQTDAKCGIGSKHVEPAHFKAGWLSSLVVGCTHTAQIIKWVVQGRSRSSFEDNMRGTFTLYTFRAIMCRVFSTLLPRLPFRSDNLFYNQLGFKSMLAKADAPSEPTQRP